MSTIFLHLLESGLFNDVLYVFIDFGVMKRYNAIGENETLVGI